MHPQETGDEKFSWSALEYEERERSQDWFWALGVIVVAGSLASMIFGNYFFAALIAISGALLGFFAMKAPDLVTYELNHQGLKIRNRLYLYEDMKAFWIQTSQTKRTPEGQLHKPTLFIKTSRFFMPILSIPIEDGFAEDLYSLLSSKDIPEEEMLEHPSEKIMDFLGF